MSGRFSNTSAKPRSRASVAELRAGIGDHREPAAPVGARPGPLEVAARLDGGAGLRRRQVQRRGGVALEAEPRDGRRVGGVEDVEARAARRRLAGCGRAPPGRGSTRPCPSRATCSMPSTSASQRLVSAGQVGLHLRDDRDPARAGRPARWDRRARACGRRRTGARTASRSTQVVAGRRGRRRRSRSRRRLPAAIAHARAMRRRRGDADLVDRPRPVWARPGNITS